MSSRRPRRPQRRRSADQRGDATFGPAPEIRIFFGMNASRPAISWRDHTGPPRRRIKKGWTNVKDFLAPSLGLGACSFLRRGIAQQHLRPWVYLRGISAMGIPALVPFRD